MLRDVALDEPLPRGARPDHAVDGTIELERLEDISRYAQRTVQLFDGRIVAEPRELVNEEAVLQTTKAATGA